MLKDINASIRGYLIQTMLLNFPHFQTLFGERSSGSQWGMNMSPLVLQELPWAQLKREHYVEGTHLPFCEYFALSPDNVKKYLPDATQDMLVLPQALAEGVDVQAGQGDHGLQLESKEIVSLPAKEAWMIVGPAEMPKEGSDWENPSWGVNWDLDIKSEKMIWTAYPGNITAPLPKDWDGNVESLDKETNYAVKAVAS